MKRVIREEYKTKHVDFMGFYRSNEETRGFYAWVVCGLFDHHQWAISQTVDGEYIMVTEWDKHYKQLVTRYHRILTSRKHGAHFKREGWIFKLPSPEGNSWHALMVGRVGKR